MQGLTVKQLINELERYDKNANVGFSAIGWTPVIGVRQCDTPQYITGGGISGKINVIRIY